MRANVTAAIAIITSLTVNGTAAAQSAVDEAHSTANRLLDGAGGSVVFTSGRVLEPEHYRISNVRTVNRCETYFRSTNPHHRDFPPEANGQVDDAGIDWNEITSTRTSGDHFYYDQTRERTGRPFTYHVQLASSGAVEQFAAAAKVLVAACAKGADTDDQAAEEAVHDPRGNSASLAIDRRNGSAYGWAIDHKSLSASDTRSLAECNRRGKGCQVVLRFTGGCGAYAADQAKGSSVYGWGTAPTRAAAEERAWNEARQRGGSNLVTRVWGCNSVKASGGVNASAIGGESGPGSNATGGRTGTGLSDEVIRRNAEAQAAHQQRLDEFQRQLKANEQQIADSRAKGRAAQEAHERELAKTRAAQAQYERERQAYREEYKRITGRYPGE